MTTNNSQIIAFNSVIILPENCQLTFDIDYEVEKGDDGKDYLVPKKLHFDFEVKDNANFVLTNLFNGNKELSKYDCMIIMIMCDQAMWAADIIMVLV